MIGGAPPGAGASLGQPATQVPLRPPAEAGASKGSLEPGRLTRAARDKDHQAPGDRRRTAGGASGLPSPIEASRAHRSRKRGGSGLGNGPRVPAREALAAGTAAMLDFSAAGPGPPPGAGQIRAAGLA